MNARRSSLWRSRVCGRVRAEVELWYYDNEQRRAASYARLLSVVDHSGGQIVDHPVVPGIGYDGSLVDVTIAELRNMAAREPIRLIILDDIMFTRPQTLVSFPVETSVVEESLPPTAALPPIAALFDGVPVQQHRLLANRLVVDDPDDLEAQSLVSERGHGTAAMASLILHGDRNLSEPPPRCSSSTFRCGIRIDRLPVR